MAIFKREFWAKLSTVLDEATAIDTKPTSKIEITVGKYTTLFKTMKIRTSWESRIVFAADLVAKNKTRYEKVTTLSGVPWHIIGVIHLLESNCNFKTHLHNGDRATVPDEKAESRVAVLPSVTAFIVLLCIKALVLVSPPL